MSSKTKQPNSQKNYNMLYKFKMKLNEYTYINVSFLLVKVDFFKDYV